MVVLDLCSGSGAWSAPFAEAGYEVILVDTELGLDVRSYVPPQNVWGVLAAPPCTEFANSGARWWPRKPPHLLADAILVAKACLRIIDEAHPVWWALENPIGRIAQVGCVPELGKVTFMYQPYEYEDFWSKKSFVWGNVSKPEPTTLDIGAAKAVAALSRYDPWHYSPTEDRHKLRSVTSEGFAKAFYNQVIKQYGDGNSE